MELGFMAQLLTGSRPGYIWEYDPKYFFLGMNLLDRLTIEEVK